MTQEIYEKVIDVLNSIDQPMELNQILIKLNSANLQETGKLSSNEKINALIKYQRDMFLSKKSEENFTLEDNLYITQSQQKTKRNEYLLLLGKIQLKKIEVLTQFYTNHLEKQQAVHSMQELLKQEASTRKEMLIYDMRARNIVNKTKQRIQGEQITDTKVITKDEEIILHLDIESSVSSLPEPLLLSPKILDCYALDILVVLSEQKDFKKK